MQIVAMTGLSYPPVRAAIDLFEAGAGALFDPPCGGAAGVMAVCSAKCKKTRFKR